jgi:predicted transcriptional regulator
MNESTMDIVEKFLKINRKESYTARQLSEKLDIPIARINKACNGLVARSIVRSFKPSYYMKCRIYHLETKKEVQPILATSISR